MYRIVYGSCFLLLAVVLSLNGQICTKLYLFICTYLLLRRCNKKCIDAKEPDSLLLSSLLL